MELQPFPIKDRATIIVDPQDRIINDTIIFIAKVLGEHYFDIIDASKDGEQLRPGGPIASKQAPAAEDSVSNSEEKDDLTTPSCVQILPASNKAALRLNSQPNDVNCLEESLKYSETLCQYPLLYISHEPMVCYAGLCTVVRQMVHFVHKLDFKLKAISLLGENESCLKSYSEVSNWTKFCENDLPRASRSVSENFKVGKSETSTLNGLHYNVKNILRKMEVELKTAKSIKNKRKYHGNGKRKWITKIIEESFEGKYFKDGLRTEYIDRIIADLSNIWSPYLIGFQMTVADLIAVSIVLQMLFELSSLVDLEKVEVEVPLVFRWLRQMFSIPVIKTAAKDSWVQIVNIDESKKQRMVLKTSQSWGDCHSTITPVSQTRLEQKNSKIRVQHQTRIQSTLESINDYGIAGDDFKSTFSCSEINFEDLPLDLNPSKGDLNKSRALRKQKQISNLYAAVKLLAKPGNVIVDFCAGGGHVGIVLAYFLPACQVILVENKEQSVARAVGRISNLGLKNIRICHSNLDYFCGHFDIGVALHACGVATDLVMDACLRERASYVVTPCCYGSIKHLETISFPRSKSFQCKIALEDYMVLTHSADMTSWDEKSPKNDLAKSSMFLIDTDRCSYMREFGYVTKICTMIPADCTPKNHVLIGEISN
eukprot:gene6758-7518_t